VCGTCADDYTKNSNGACSECPEDGANEARLVFVMLGVMLILAIMVR